MRQPPANSVSARCARISAIDHFPGAGRLVSCFLFSFRISVESFLAVVCCTCSGSLLSMWAMMRWVYCCGVSGTTGPPACTFRGELKWAYRNNQDSKSAFGHLGHRMCHYSRQVRAITKVCFRIQQKEVESASTNVVGGLCAENAY